MTKAEILKAARTGAFIPTTTEAISVLCEHIRELEAELLSRILGDAIKNDQASE
jgi:hypothetical protein